MTGASYGEADTYSGCQVVARIDAEEFMPYAHDKSDDYAALHNQAQAP